LATGVAPPLQIALANLVSSHEPWARAGVVAKARMARKIRIAERMTDLQPDIGLNNDILGPTPTSLI